MEKKDITLKSSSEREQNQLAGSAEHEKIKGSQNLNMPNLRFPEFSGEWETKRLDECASFLDEQRKPIKSTERSSEFKLYPYYGASGVIDYIDDYIFDEDLILLSEDGANILDRNYRVAFIVTGKTWVNNHAHVLRPVNDVDISYLSEYLESLRYEKYNTGSTMPKLNQEVCRGIRVWTPKYEEQKKIGRLLSAINERIETQKKIIEKYESLIRGLSNKLLDASKGTSVRLGDILIERSERTKRNNQHEVLSSTVKGIFSQREYFSKDIASENNVGYKVIRRNDVVLSPQNLWMGNINYNDKYDIGIVSPSYKIFSIAEGYDKRFVSALLKTHRALYNYMQVSEQGASVVRRNLNMEAFEQLTFKIPPYTKQCEIGRILDSMQNRLGLAISTQICLEQQKQWLLRNLFI